MYDIFSDFVLGIYSVEKTGGYAMFIRYSPNCFSPSIVILTIFFFTISFTKTGIFLDFFFIISVR